MHFLSICSVLDLAGFFNACLISTYLAKKQAET